MITSITNINVNSSNYKNSKFSDINYDFYSNIKQPTGLFHVLFLYSYLHCGHLSSETFIKSVLISSISKQQKIYTDVKFNTLQL